jgi:hypothetical protein
MNNRPTPCRPGFGASCSFCCGSHNYTISPELIEAIFISRDDESGRRLTWHPEESCEKKLVRKGMQCSHVGISQSDPGLVCCLTYFDDHEGSGFESFFKGTCKNFLCAAWNELTDRQVSFAAELMKDWYYYSLLINSLDILVDLCAEYESPEDVPAEVLEELKIELKKMLMEEDMI